MTEFESYYRKRQKEFREKHSKNGKFHIKMSGLRYAYNLLKRFPGIYKKERRLMIEREIKLHTIKYNFNYNLKNEPNQKNKSLKKI